MKRDEVIVEDTLREEYDLKSLEVRKLGSERKHRATVQPDVAEVFPSADAVNEALRLLIRVMRDNRELFSTAQENNSEAKDTANS